MKVNNSGSGNSAIDKKGQLAVDVATLDHWDVGAKVDFLKVDCEGFEYFVMKGAEGVIKPSRPCIIVEQKTGMGSKYGLSDTAAVELLQSWGAKLRFEMSGDYCLSWD